MRVILNEKQWRQYLALEAKERGSMAQVAQVSHNTIRRGIREVEAGEGYTPGQRQRAKGGGHKKESGKDPTLLSGLEGLLEPKGDPMSLLKWTSKSVAHYPPATSKWNKIEHRLFSFTSSNWRAKPLTSLEVVLELISHTTTNEGLMVMAVKDRQIYPTGLKVTYEHVAALNLFREPFHGEWNYTIKPQES
jgi:Rhodopirellula transposase DDE domain